jgi:hypothetical protein
MLSLMRWHNLFANLRYNIVVSCYLQLLVVATNMYVVFCEALYLSASDLSNGREAGLWALMCCSPAV